jgi:hypothetical protein
MWKLDVLVLAAQIIAAVFVGFFVVGRWIFRLWEAQSWWHLSLLTGLSLFLFIGFALEIRARRLGSFGVVVVGLALVFGTLHLLNSASG